MKWQREQRGFMALEVAILVPVAMLLVLVVVQMALWAHAATIVEAAASQGDYAACLYGEPIAEGQMQADDVLNSEGKALVLEPTVQVSATSDDLIEVHVSGVAESVLPWLRLPVSSTQIGSKQQFRGAQ